ncbi:hypothetical protein RJ639_004393 [Escallonia herrerae]|uniref:Retrotransposon Copia-like N-terminal domain-containing protein n=1 Tax=Escallonia herrerae TaxID=1293975 RepID=A0AA88W478_9ASTE|nr:hypothetical protein RJ639_004393 [Escallonia herrerae]
MMEATANSNHGGLMSITTSTPPGTVIDINSPYYLPASNHPGLIFVTHPLNENGENYFTCGRNFLNALPSKNKAGFVDRTIGKPDVNSQNFQPWVQCNAIILSWLTNALAKEIQSSAAHADTASEVWSDLQERFTQGIDPRFYELKRAIALLQQEKTTISSYYGKLKYVWNELQASNPIPVCTCECTCGAAKKMESMQEEEKVYDFLMGLDDIFSTVRSQKLSVDPLPTLGRAYAIAAQEEKLRENKTRGNGEKLRCTQCGKPNHTKEQCYELVGYPANWSVSRHRSSDQRRPKGANEHACSALSSSALWTAFTTSSPSSDSPTAFTASFDAKSSTSPIPGLNPIHYQQLMDLLGQGGVEAGTSTNLSDNFSGKTATEIPWVIDAGATDHITGQLDILIDKIENPNIAPVEIPNGDKVPVKSMGQVMLSNNLVLKNVLRDLPLKRLIGVGKARRGLYFLESTGGGTALVVVSRSSAEAEYQAMATTTSELIWMVRLLRELHVPCSSPIPLYCNNQAATHIAANPVFHERTKHIEIDCHFIRHHVQTRMLLPQSTSTQHQLADIFTKALGHERFHDLLSKLGISNLHAPT